MNTDVWEGAREEAAKQLSHVKSMATQTQGRLEGQRDALVSLKASVQQVADSRAAWQDRHEQELSCARMAAHSSKERMVEGSVACLVEAEEVEGWLTARLQPQVAEAGQALHALMSAPLALPAMPQLGAPPKKPAELTTNGSHAGGGSLNELHPPAPFDQEVAAAALLPFQRAVQQLQSELAAKHADAHRMSGHLASARARLAQYATLLPGLLHGTDRMTNTTQHAGSNKLAARAISPSFASSSTPAAPRPSTALHPHPASAASRNVGAPTLSPASRPRSGPFRPLTLDRRVRATASQAQSMGPMGDDGNDAQQVVAAFAVQSPLDAAGHEHLDGVVCDKCMQPIKEEMYLK